MWRTVIALVLAGLVLGTGVPGALALDDELYEEPGPAASLGFGMAAIGTSLVYMPAKMLYALGGGLVGLMAWGVTAGDDQVAMGILQPSLGGTWVVTPEMLRGKDPILFQGPTYERRSHP
jgi:hypothetical protein